MKLKLSLSHLPSNTFHDHIGQQFLVGNVFYFYYRQSWNLRNCICLLLLLLLLSHFSRVRLRVTPSLGFSRQEHWSGLPFPSPMHKSEKWKWSHSVMSDSSWPHGLQPTRLLHPWDFPGKSTGVGCHCLLWICLLGPLNFKMDKSSRIWGYRMRMWKLTQK